MSHIDTAHLGDQLVAARPALDAVQQSIAIALYRLLAEGRPVSRGQLAERAGARLADIGRLLDEQPGVYFDSHGQVVGFWGMALDEMPHRMRVDGRDIYAWCAWDTLFLPELIASTVTVASTCPTTGQPITLVVAPDGAHRPEPASAVLSFLRRETPFDADAISTFCHFVHFFVSDDAGRRWAARHDGTFVLSIDEGVAIARRVNARSFAAILERAAESPR